MANPQFRAGGITSDNEEVLHMLALLKNALAFCAPINLHQPTLAIDEGCLCMT
ncbi:MAG: hypothetical protein KUG81_09110 [Gammaproteobacteria bacterium]|nr:hypothetical protein [Gammaproteobacteria bacterium]